MFGLGNASGTVNQVPAAANLTRDRSRAEFRTDSYKGYRSSLDLNRVLVKGKLAVRASGSYQHDGFEGKPSGVNSVRYNAMIKAQPYQSTTLSGSFLYYRMNGNRPNYTPPRDYISDWVAAGKPGCDPIAQVVHLNGQTLGPFTADATVPYYFSRAGTMQTRSNIFVDQSGLSYWTAANTNNPASVPFTPAANNQTIRLMQSGVNLGTIGASPGRLTNQPLFTTTPSVSGKNIYDWSAINLSSVNRLMDETQAFNLQLDQLRDLRLVSEAVERGSGVTRFLAEAVRGLSFTYNKSDNFIPQAPAVDLYLNPLPNISGKGKDFGFWLNMADGRFVLRVNRWETSQLNARDGDANVRNLQESGRLQAIGVFPDGTPNAYRIVDPRQFILSATFDL